MNSKIEEVANAFRFDPLPDKVRAVTIAPWKSGGLLPPAAIEQMVPGAEPEATECPRI